MSGSRAAFSLFFLSLLLLLLIPDPASARTWRVTADHPGDAPGMQAGIDSAAAADTVPVGAGTHRERINFLGKDVVASPFLVKSGLILGNRAADHGGDPIVAGRAANRHDRRTARTAPGSLDPGRGRPGAASRGPKRALPCDPPSSGCILPMSAGSPRADGTGAGHRVEPGEGKVMHMEIVLHESDRVDAVFKGLAVSTRQDGSAPAPFDLFLASIGTCAGIYVSRFCRQRGIPAADVRIVQTSMVNPETRMVDRIELEIRLPADFPEEYRDAVVRSANLCAVKKHLEHPPEFAVRTVTAARA